MIDLDISKIISNIQFMDKIYDSARFVDPVKKKIIGQENEISEVSCLHCFDIWGKNSACDNCVSIRAYNENMTFVKFEYIEDKNYMITAVPYELNGKRIIIELIKDTSNSIFLGTDSNSTANMNNVHLLIDDLNKMALKDFLTGTYNRRYIDEKLPVDMINAVLLSQQLSVIMIDIDFFKKVNDTYGHLAGDCVLKGLTDVVTGCIRRGSDWIARFGGEEFLVCLPGADATKAAEIAELMRKSIETTEFCCENNNLSVTASFGVSSTRPDQNQSAEDMIRGADEKLYLAKKNGRNRVEV